MNTNDKPSTSRSLLECARRIAESEGDDHGPADASETPDEILASTRISTLLALAILQDTLTPRQLALIDGGGGIAVVVGVPDPDWIAPIERAFRRIAAWGSTFSRSGSNKSGHKPEVGNDEVADDLADGKSVLGISHLPERYLPSALIAGADVRITLSFPSDRAIRSVIRLVTGRRVGTMPKLIARGLSYDQICSSIRRGSTPSASIRRLVAASRQGAGADPALSGAPFLEDAHGYGEAKAWGLSLIAEIREWREGRLAWRDMTDRAVVLGGDPGVGKTLFARSLAKSAGLALHATSVSAWFASTNGYLNDITKQIDTVLRQAASSGPAILLLDELDALPNRATLDARHRDYWTPVVTHMLLALDSVVTGDASHLIIIGATNHPSRLDDALVRPGRLSRVLTIERPETQDLSGILRHHLGNDLPDADLMPLAIIGTGATGAEAAAWAKAARGSARTAGRDVTVADLLAQIAPPDTRSPSELWACARHEAAHAVLTEVLHVGTVSHVTTVGRGSYAGRTRSRLRSTGAMTRHDLDAFVVAALAGRAADELWGTITAGSSGGQGSDLAVATSMVAGAHGTWNLGGNLTFLGTEPEVTGLLRLDPAFRRTVEADLQRLYADAQTHVSANRHLIDILARKLIEQRVVSGDVVRAIIAAPSTDEAALLADIASGGVDG